MHVKKAKHHSQVRFILFFLKQWIGGLFKKKLALFLKNLQWGTMNQKGSSGSLMMTETFEAVNPRLMNGIKDTCNKRIE